MARTPRSSSSSGRRPMRAAEDAVAPRVERLDARAEARQARRHLLLGLLVVGEGDARLPLVATVGEQVAVALGEHAGLARAGRGDDPRRPGAVGDGLELVGRQHALTGATGAGCGVSRPSSTVSRWTTAAPSIGTASGARGPPSIHAGVPSGSTTSASPPSVAPSRAALRDHHQIGSPSPRAS